MPGARLERQGRMRQAEGRAGVEGCQGEGTRGRNEFGVAEAKEGVGRQK